MSDETDCMYGELGCVIPAHSKRTHRSEMAIDAPTLISVNTKPPYPFALRPSTEDDVGFVKTTWLSSYHDRALGSISAASLAWGRYKALMRPLTAALIERGTLVIACDPEVPSVLYGWALGEGGEVPMLHYAYVRPERRRYGLYREMHARLSEQTGKLVEASHMTEAGRWIAKSKGLQYNPLVARLAA